VPFVVGEMYSSGVLQQSRLGLFLQPLKIPASATGPASNPAHKDDFPVEMATSQSNFLMERARASAISLSVKSRPIKNYPTAERWVLSFKHRVSIMVKRSFIFTNAATWGCVLRGCSGGGRLIRASDVRHIVHRYVIGQRT
jgi:hypothetical protein